MAYPLLANPQFGGPGQPQWLNYWLQNQFVMPGAQPQPAAPQPAPMAPTVTPQDVAANQETASMARGGGLLGDSGGNNALERDPSFADPTRAGRGLNITPADWGTLAGYGGGLLGMAVPGVGGALIGPAASAIGHSLALSPLNTELEGLGATGRLGFGDVLGSMVNGLGFGLGGGLTGARSMGERFADLADSGAPDEPAAAAPAAPNPWTDIFGGAGTFTDTPAPAPGSPWNDIFGGAGNFTDTPSAPEPGNPWHDIFGGAGNFAKGGRVPKPGPGSYNPPGPDDQIAAVQSGEGLLTRTAMKKFPGLLEALNKGDAKKARGLLGR